MLRYLAKRLIYAVLVVFAVSLLAFFMSTIAPGDLVDAHLTLDGAQIAYKQKSFSERTAEYTRSAERLGMLVPQFYFSVQPICFPDTLYRVVRKEERQILKQLLFRHGDWPLIELYRKQTLGFIRHLEPLRDDLSKPWAAQVSSEIEFLLTTADTGRIHYLLQSISNLVPADAFIISDQAQHLITTYSAIQNKRTGFWKLMPSFTWHGRRSQYHQWITKTLSGDLGRSLIDGRPVKTKITEALRWTLNVNIIAILLAFGIAIPLGVATARHAGDWTDKFISSILFALYAMPSFWLAMLCIVFLTTSEYGTWLDLFPTGGVG